MGESRSWSWEVPAFEGRSSSAAADEDEEDNLILSHTANSRHLSVNSPLSRRFSLPAHLGASAKRGELTDVANKLVKLRELLVTTRSEFLDIRQEASDLQEYSNAKLTRVTRYLGVLADKTHRITSDYEHRLALLRKEKSLHFNDLVSSKGNTRVIVRARPPLAAETITTISFPDEFTICINNREKLSGPPVEFRFDQVYEPRVSQGEFFQDIQPLVQSALDGYNVSIFACGAKGSGKTYTLEGPSHDRGVYFRAFEELFDLSNGESTPQSQYKFFVTMAQLCSDKVEDLLVNAPTDADSRVDRVQLNSSLELTRHEVATPTDFARTFKAGLQSQHCTGLKTDDLSSPCLIVTIHVYYSNACTREEQYSKLSLVDVPGSEESVSAEGVSSSFLSLVEVVSAVVSRKDQVQYKKSKISRVLSDSIGGDSKTLVILNISPSDSDVDLTKSWLKVARLCNDSSRTLQNKIFEEQNKELKLEVEKLKKALKTSEDRCAILFSEIHKSGKLLEDPSERGKLERVQIVQLKTQVAQLAKYDRDQKAELANRASKILALEDKLQEMAQELVEAQAKNQSHFTKHVRTTSDLNGMPPPTVQPDNRFGEELAKRDELIERLHEENEKLFQRLTERGTFSPKARQPEPPAVENFDLSDSMRESVKPTSSPLTAKRNGNNNSTKNLEPSLTNALQKMNSKSTPAGEYLTAALSDFDVDLYQGSAAVADAANKLLMLVLAAVIKAGAAREHDMLEEIRGAVFAFIRKLEPRKVMDTMLVSRVRILYVRSLLARSPELQAIKVPSLDKFIEKVGPKSSRTSSSGSSPTRSPLSSQIPASMKKEPLDEQQVTPFRVNLKPEKTSKLSSIVLRLRGIDQVKANDFQQETWKQHLTGAKLREMNEDARNYAIGNKKLAALFVHTPAGELQRQIRAWLADNFDFLSITTSSSSINSGALGQLDLLSTAIMDGWMAGLGIPVRPTTDALGHLLSDYTKHVYMSQLQNLKDVAATMATEEAEDITQINKIRTALEAVDHKRRKILQQMRSDPALLTKEEGGSPLRCPSTASEEARIASLVSLESICSQAEEIMKEAPGKAARYKFFMSRLDSLTEQTSALLSIDHPCANRFIRSARRAAEAAAGGGAADHTAAVRRRTSSDDAGDLSSSSGDWSNENPAVAASEIVQWSVLQFNTGGSETPFIIKCGATASMQLVIKAAGAGGRETVAVVPSPTSLAGLSLEDIRQALRGLPEAFTKLAMAKTADGTRARYARLYRTLAVRVPALRNSVSDVESSGGGSALRHARRASDSDNFLTDY